MANTDVIIIIVQMASDYFKYMLPVIGVMGGIVFMASWLHHSIFGMGSKSFRG